MPQQQQCLIQKALNNVFFPLDLKLIAQNIELFITGLKSGSKFNFN